MQPLPTYASISRDPIASADALSVMVRKEQTIYKTDHCDYLPTPLTLNDENCSTVITPEDRVTIVDWCYTIIDKCNFSRESVAIAMELVHLFLSNSPSLPHTATTEGVPPTTSCPTGGNTNS